MPPGLYLSEDILALEQREIFAKDWICAGRADELRREGEYLTFSFAGQPVVVMRQPGGALKAFANVCRHRMMTLLEGNGRCRAIVCPYHAWTYDLDGQLKKAPHMDRSEGFDAAAVRLAEVRCEVWHGWIYLSLNPQARAVSELLAELEPLVEPYGLGDYVHVIRQDHLWKTNWKVLTENFMEGLHLPYTHRKTVGAWFPAEETAFGDLRHDAFTYQTFLKSEDAVYGRAHPKNTRLEGIARRRSLMPTVFPSHMYVLAPDHCWYLSLVPESAGEVRVRFGVSLAPEVIDSLDDPEAEIVQLESFFDQVNDEDRAIVEGIYRGLSSPLAEPGALSWLEKELHDFQCYLAKRLSPAGAPRLKKVGT